MSRRNRKSPSRPNNQNERAPASAVPAPAAALPDNPPPHSRYPLSPEEEERLRDEIVDRLLAMRCGLPERCANAVCRRKKRCRRRAGTGAPPPPAAPS